MNFIIFENDDEVKAKLMNMIRLCFRNSFENYRIIDVTGNYEYQINSILMIDGVKVYIIDYNPDIDEDLNLVRRINASSIGNTFILLIYPKCKIDCSLLYNSHIYNILNRKGNFYRSLYINIKNIYERVNIDKFMTFSYYHETYRIPFKDIYYIEKNSNDDALTIHTKYDSYNTYCSIRKMDELLRDDIRFFKTHRSCIINIFKVLEFYQASNSIIFDDNSTINLVCRSKKRELVDKLRYIHK